MNQNNFGNNNGYQTDNQKTALKTSEGTEVSADAGKEQP